MRHICGSPSARSCKHFNAEVEGSSNLRADGLRELRRTIQAGTHGHKEMRRICGRPNPARELFLLRKLYRLPSAVTGILLQATGKRPYSRRDRPAILTAAIASRAAIWRGRTRGELARKAEGPPGRRTVAHRAGGESDWRGGAAITYVARPGNAAEPRIVPVRMGREILLAPPARLSTELPFAQRAPGTNVFPHVRAFPHVVVFPHFRRVHMPQTSRAVLACCSSGRGDLCSAICARSVPTGVGAAMRSPGKRLGQGGEVRTTPETRPRRERNQSAS